MIDQSFSVYLFDNQYPYVATACWICWYHP